MDPFQYLPDCGSERCTSSRLPPATAVSTVDSATLSLVFNRNSTDHDQAPGLGLVPILVFLVGQDQCKITLLDGARLAVLPDNNPLALDDVVDVFVRVRVERGMAAGLEGEHPKGERR